jgi:hypothetical protein
VSWPGADGALLGILALMAIASVVAVRLLSHERYLASLSPVRKGVDA